MALLERIESPESVVSKRPRARLSRRWLLPLALTVAIGVFVIAPVIRMQQLALSDGAAGYAEAFGSGDIPRVIMLTAVLAMGSLIVALVFGTALAWAATRLPRRLQILRVFPILPMILPPVAAVIGWTFLLSPRPGFLNAAIRALPWWSGGEDGPVDIYTLPWLILLTGFMLTSFVYLFVSSGFANINGEVLEAALTSGMNNFTAFFRITIPLLRPALVYGSAVALLMGLGQFTVPLLLGANQNIDVLTTRMFYYTADSPVDFAASAALGSPLIVFGLVVVVLQWMVLGQKSRFVTHGGKAFRTRGDGSWVAVVVILVFTLLAVALPMMALAVVALSPFWSGVVQTSEFTLDNFREIFADATFTSSIVNSVFVSLAAVAITIPLGYVCATLLVRERGPAWIRHTLDTVITLPLAIPGVVFGLGILLTYGRPPFGLYATQSIVLITYVTIMIPFAVRMIMTGMTALGSAYDEAARTCGASAVRTHAWVLLPLLRPAIGGAAALIFVLLTHEFTASLFVRSPEVQVMGTALFDAYSEGSYPAVAALAIVMTVVTAIGAAVAVLFGGSNALTRL